MYSINVKGIQYQFSSVAQLCPTLYEPMNRSSPGLPVHHKLPEFTQTHVHRVSDAIQPSHPLSSPSPPAPNPSQHQSLFQWVNSSHEEEDTPRPRSGGVALRRYPMSKVRSSSCACWSSLEEIPHIQGKRNPSKMVGTKKGHQSADRLKSQSQKTS